MTFFSLATHTKALVLNLDDSKVTATSAIKFGMPLVLLTTIQKYPMNFVAKNDSDKWIEDEFNDLSTN